MSNHAEIQKFRKDIEMLEKMQSLHFFDCMPVSCSRRVMRVPGGGFTTISISNTQQIR